MNRTEDLNFTHSLILQFDVTVGILYKARKYSVISFAILGVCGDFSSREIIVAFKTCLMKIHNGAFVSSPTFQSIVYVLLSWQPV